MGGLSISTGGGAGTRVADGVTVGAVTDGAAVARSSDDGVPQPRDGRPTATTDR